MSLLCLWRSTSMRTALAIASRRPAMLRDVSKQQMIGPRSAAGLSSSAFTAQAGRSSQTVRS
eukprot:277237-Amphidinium_carterae.1